MWSSVEESMRCEGGDAVIKIVASQLIDG
jgi:hypothetical protein